LHYPSLSGSSYNVRFKSLVFGYNTRTKSLECESLIQIIILNLHYPSLSGSGYNVRFKSLMFGCNTRTKSLECESGCNTRTKSLECESLIQIIILNLHYPSLSGSGYNVRFKSLVFGCNTRTKSLECESGCKIVS